MSEYPARSCGKCPHRGQYEAVAEKKGDYLQTNTIPKPDLINKETTNLREVQLGVPSTLVSPDLQATPLINIPPPSQYPPQTKFQTVVPEPHMVNCCCAQEISEKQKIECPETPYSLPKFGDDVLNTTQPIETPKVLNAHTIPQPVITNASPKEIKGILKKTTNFQPETDTPKTQKKVLQQETKPEEKTVERECYFPRREDEFPKELEVEMSPLGPWATGRVDWGPLKGLTGTRPIVDKYSVARFSEGEWRNHNKEVIDSLSLNKHQANMLEYNSREGIEQTRSNTDKNQEDNTLRLNLREQELHRWKCELERAISASAEEIGNIQEQRRRLKQSMAVLQLPESIAGECLDRRTGRLDPELVRDEVEEELIKELALTAEIREQFTRTLMDIEHQLLENKTAKSRLEYDWSDKKQADEIECINVALNNKSNTLLFKPGAVGFPDNQSTQEYWEKFTRDTLEESEITRQRSVALRGTLDAILLNAAKNLRAQADKVDMALAKRISCTDEIRARLENELKGMLKQLADIETTIKNLKDMIRRMDTSLKKAQTRLDNRLMHRPRVENCRDQAHYGLVDEVKSIMDSVSALQSQLSQAEDVQSALMASRNSVEREIMVKRKTLEIDRERTKMIRSYYPSEAALTGY